MKTKELPIFLTVLIMGLLSVGLAFTQVQLRQFLGEWAGFEGTIPRKAVLALMSGPFWLAVLSFGVCGLGWLLIMPRVQLVLAYPMLSLSYVAMLGFSRFMYHESASRWSVVGILCIVVGVTFIGIGYAKHG